MSWQYFLQKKSESNKNLNIAADCGMSRAARLICVIGSTGNSSNLTNSDFKHEKWNENKIGES